MTKKDFEKYVEDKENNPDTLYGKTRKMEPCVNNRRGSFCLQDSYDSTSGPMGLTTDLGSDTPPSISMQERVIAHTSPSYARAAAVSTGEPLSVAPGQKRQHMEIHHGQEAHCDDQECTSHVPSSAVPAVAVTSRENTTGGAGEAEIHNNSEGEWVQVVRQNVSVLNHCCDKFCDKSEHKLIINKLEQAETKLRKELSGDNNDKEEFKDNWLETDRCPGAEDFSCIVVPHVNYPSQSTSRLLEKG
ncbi:unnamed protein product [Parnassius apollo]|uniref:(apollo) hypothetical protein n=1 Tax=Parnassius apollo TaxID=110799 RepID=A0A8S3W0V0_PARAO|nr:unnamed protein product [Parnassius apollo]